MMKLTGFIKASLLVGGMLYFLPLFSQELYVFTEPASNMPSKSLSIKLTGKLAERREPGKLLQRYTPEIMFGLNKKGMLHLAPTFSNMYSANQRWESARMYAKYRFLSNDEVHKHFRMAAFGELAYSRNRAVFDEVSIDGDLSGLQGGVVATQLVNKLALSATGSFTRTLPGNKNGSSLNVSRQAVNYSVSAGFLVLPVNYTSFRQTNLNIYAELLGQQAVDMKKYFVDFAPAVQLIFNSNAKLNVGYRFQVDGNMNRMANRSWLISFERTFFGAL